jgi:ADP-ribose pyrophosphatase YjhB (NUDIX family)
VSVGDALPQFQRVAAYNVCVDASSGLLLCRLSDITERPGWWTLPGGGIDFGEHPEEGALRELHEETGLVGKIVGLLAVDSLRRTLRATERDRLGFADGAQCDYHSVRIVYRTEIIGGDLRDETDESTDMAAWFTHEDAATLPLVELGRLGVELAFGVRGSAV